MKSRTRHHYATFYAVAALGEGSELAMAATDVDDFRLDRHAASYGTRASEARMRGQLGELHAALSRFLPLVREWLASNRPSLAESLPPPS